MIGINKCSLFFILWFLFNSSAFATLIDRGGGLLYDDEQDITWLADFNPSKTLGGEARFYWDDAFNFIDNFTYYDSVRDVTWDDWRMPTLERVDPACSEYGTFASPDDSPLPMGLNCENSELSHLFYQDLGGVATRPINEFSNSNTDYFLNLPDQTRGGDNSYLFWTGDDYYINSDFYFITDRDIAFGFSFGYGDQFFMPKNRFSMVAMAVRDGDVGVAKIPEPSTLWLMLAALIGVTSIKVKRKVR